MREGKCIHFNGTCNDECDLNVNYRELVGGDDFGWAVRTPCLDSHESEIKCDGRELLSKEAIEEYEADQEIRMDGWRKAIALIMEKSGAKPDHSPSMDNSKKGSRGKIECPLCGNDLHYTVAGGNHHIWGKCTTEGCLSWMM